MKVCEEVPQCLRKDASMCALRVMRRGSIACMQPESFTSQK